MVFPHLKITTENIAELADHMASAPLWAPQFIDANMEGLGRRVSAIMKAQVKRHRYKGDLEDSITHDYDSFRIRLEIGPRHKRGKYDAGLLLQRGTKPIPNVPFGPIKRWAEFRGLPAGPVWWKIKTKGVSAHPFLGETLQRGDTQTAIKHTAQRIGMDLAAAAVQKIPVQGAGGAMKIRSVVSDQMGFGGL